MPTSNLLIRFACLLFTACGLAGCASVAVMSHVPLSTMQRLWSFDVAKLDINGFRVAARLPDTLEPRSVKVTIEVSGQGNAPRRREELSLVAATEPAEIAPLSTFQRSGFKLFVYRLSAADAQRLDKLRAYTPAGRGGTIAAAVDACRRRELPKGALPSTTLLRIDAAGYFVLLDDLDLRAIATDKELAKDVAPCG